MLAGPYCSAVGAGLRGRGLLNQACALPAASMIDLSQGHLNTVAFAANLLLRVAVVSLIPDTF